MPKGKRKTKAKIYIRISIANTREKKRVSVQISSRRRRSYRRFYLIHFYFIPSSRSLSPTLFQHTNLHFSIRNVFLSRVNRQINLTSSFLASSMFLSSSREKLRTFSYPYAYIYRGICISIFTRLHKKTFLPHTCPMMMAWYIFGNILQSHFTPLRPIFTVYKTQSYVGLHTCERIRDFVLFPFRI